MLLTLSKFFNSNQIHMSIRKLQLVFQFCGFVILTALCVISSAAQNSVDINQKFSPEQLIEDIDFYHKTIEETHINPYVYIPRKDWLARANDIKSRIKQQGAMTQREFWLLFAPLVSAFQDKHTFIVHPRFFIANNQTKYLPIRAVYVDGRIPREDLLPHPLLSDPAGGGRRAGRGLARATRGGGLVTRCITRLKP